MKVRCTTNDLSQITDLSGVELRPKKYLHIEINQEFTVIGMHFDSNPCIPEIMAWVYIQFDEFPRMTFAPLSLFEITDPRPSRHWHMETNKDGCVFLTPDFFRKYEYPFSDLEEDHPPEGMVDDFLEMMRKLENEFKDREMT